MNFEGQRGGILLELLLFVLVLAFFTAGAARIHVAFGRRFTAIVHDRNATMERARKSAGPGRTP